MRIGPDAILIDVGDKYETVHYFHRHESGVNRVFIDNPMFLPKVWGMADSKIYDSVASTDNHDTQLCFSLLCLDPITMAAARMSTSGPSSAQQPLLHATTASSWILYKVEITTLERIVLLDVWIVWKTE